MVESYEQDCQNRDGNVVRKYLPESYTFQMADDACEAVTLRVKAATTLRIGGGRSILQKKPGQTILVSVFVSLLSTKYTLLALSWRKQLHN